MFSISVSLHKRKSHDFLNKKFFEKFFSIFQKKKDSEAPFIRIEWEIIIQSLETKQ